MGARTDAARAEVLARRQEVADELVRLEASGRAAVDIPARMKRAPAQTAGVAAGAAFLVLGGPGRILRGIRRAVKGPDADLPKTMLPKEVDAALRKLGPDGDRVRGTIEREFAKYLDEHAEARKDRDLGGTAALVLGNLLRPATERAGRQLAERLFEPDGAGFADALEKARARRAKSGGDSSA